MSPDTRIMDLTVGQLRQVLMETYQQAMMNIQPSLQENRPGRITRKEAAVILNVSIDTVDNYRKHGLLTTYRVGIRKVMLDRAEVEKLAGRV